MLSSQEKTTDSLHHLHTLSFACRAFHASPQVLLIAFFGLRNAVSALHKMIWRSGHDKSALVKRAHGLSREKTANRVTS